jgi:ribosomal protein S18 acetylase RimI-like enzyme
MDIIYRSDYIPTSKQVIKLYNESALPRPIDDEKRIQKMLENSSLIVTAWDKDKLVGVCRSVTDWVWCCYLSDLAVSPTYKKSGIGKKMIDLTKEKVGEQCMILLLSVPTAMTYYPKVGFTIEDRAFSIPRIK